MIDSRLRHTLLNTGGVVALLLLVLFSSVTKASTRFFTWPWVFYGQLFLLLPLFLLGWRLTTRPLVWRRPLTVLTIPAVALGISVILSRQPAFSFKAALFLWSGLAWCGLVAIHVQARLEKPTAPLRAVGSDRGRDHFHLRSGIAPTRVLPFRITGAILFVPLFVSVVFWTVDQIRNVPYSGMLDTFRQLSRNAYPFGHWNYVGGYAVLALPWLVASAWNEHGRWRVVWSVSVVIALIVLLSSLSRGAVLGLAGSMTAVLALLVMGGEISRRRALQLGIVAFVGVAVLFAGNARLRQVIFHPQTILSPSEGDVQRLGMLQAGGLLVEKSPWVGHGPGMIPFVYPEVRSQVVGGVETAYELHNGPLELAVNSGILGLLAWALLAVALVTAAIRWLRTSTSDCPREWKLFAMASATALAGYAVMFCTDYQLNVVGILALLGVHAGIVLAAPVDSARRRANSASPSDGRSLRIVKFAGIALCACTLSALVVLVPAWRARQAFWAAWWDAPGDNPSLIVQHLRDAAALAPHNPHYLNHLGFQLAENAEASKNETASASLRREARGILDRSLAVDPSQEPVHAALGWLWLNEDAVRAEHHFRAAIALLPDRDTLHAGLASSLLLQGNQPAAIRELALECLVDPSFVASPLWQQPTLAPLQTPTAARLREDYIFALKDPATPAWRKPDLIYAAAFSRWWLGGAAPQSSELVGATVAQRRAFAFLSKPTVVRSNDRVTPLRILFAAFSDPAHAESILRDMTKIPLNQDAVAGALRRLDSHPNDFSAFVRSPAPNLTGVYRQTITRGHFAIMHRVLDGPGYTDFAPRLSDAFATQFLTPLFPKRDAVPAPVVLEIEQVH